MAIAIAGCQQPDKFPNTALLQGVTEMDRETGQALLRERVESRYKEGQSEKGLEEFLRSQGFTVTRNESSLAPGTPIYGQAQARAGGGACAHIAHVNWRADAAGIIRELVVSYGDTGCL